MRAYICRALRLEVSPASNHRCTVFTGARCLLDSDFSFFLLLYSTYRILMYNMHCKKSCAKFRCGQRWREPNDVGVGKFLLPRPLVQRHSCKHRNLAHSDMAFLQCVPHLKPHFINTYIHTSNCLPPPHHILWDMKLSELLINFMNWDIYLLYLSMNEF